MPATNCNFGVFRTAYHIDVLEFPSISDGITEWDGICNAPSFMKHFENNVQLPTDWSLHGTEISGGTGFVLIFEIESLPLTEAMEAVNESIMKYEPLIKLELCKYRESDRFA